MNPENQALQKEVMTFIKRAAPAGAIKWAKSTEPHKTRISDAQAAVKAATKPHAELKRYAGAFFKAFRAFFDHQYPNPLTPEVVRGLSMQEIWHAGNRVTSVDCSSANGPFRITPRISSDPAIAPAFSAAEMQLLRVIPISRTLMVESGLIDDGDEMPTLMKTLMTVKTIFPGAVVVEIKDYIGDTNHLIPDALRPDPRPEVP